MEFKTFDNYHYEMKSINRTPDDVTLYSQISIAVATLIGTPIAAGILIRHNYINLRNRTAGNIALLLGIVSTNIMWYGISQIPKKIVIPNFFFVGISACIIYILVEILMGKELKTHRDHLLEFESTWKAAGVGIAVILIIMAIIIIQSLYVKW